MQWLFQPGKFMRYQLAHTHGPTANLMERLSSAGRSNLPYRLASGYLATDDKQKKRRSENQIAQFLHVLSRPGGDHIVSAKPLNQIENATQQFGRYEGLNEDDL